MNHKTKEKRKPASKTTEVWYKCSQCWATETLAFHGDILDGGKQGKYFQVRGKILHLCRESEPMMIGLCKAY